MFINAVRRADIYLQQGINGNTYNYFGKIKKGTHFVEKCKYE